MRYLLTFLATLLLAGPVLAQTGATTFEFAPINEELLIRSQPTSIPTTAFCIDFDGNEKADHVGTACEDIDENEWVVTQNAQLKTIKVIQIVSGDANDVCDFELEVAGTEVATFNHSTGVADTPLSSVTSYAVPYNLADGAQVGVSVNTGTSCMTGTTTVEFVVELWGTYVPDNAF
jgi:hypothetical protein